MNHSTIIPAEDDQHALSEPSNMPTTTTLPEKNTGSFNSSLSNDLALPSQSPIHEDDESSSVWLNNSTANNSSDLMVPGMNSTDQSGIETNSSTSNFTWGGMQNWNDSSFWDRSGSWGDPLLNNTATDATMSGPTHWEGYILGIFCMGTAMLFVLAPAWYMDRRRHLEFVGRERRVARSQRRRRRRRWHQRRNRRYWARRMHMMDDLMMMRHEVHLVEGQEAPTPLAEEYILDMLVTRPLQASDLCMEDQKAEETPSLMNVVSEKTDDTATLCSNKDPDMKDDDDDGDDDDDDDDDESFDLDDDDDDDEDSSSMDDEDADCCAICLNGYKIGGEICYPKESRPCPHFFHRACLVPWLLKQNVCPCCRVQYLPSPPETVGQEENELVDMPDASPMDGPLTLPADGPGEDDVPITLLEGSSQEETRSGESQSESDGERFGIEVGIESVGIESTALAPPEDSLPLPPVCESSFETTHETSEDVPTCEKGSDDDDDTSCHPKPAVALLDMKTRDNSGEGSTHSKTETDEEEVGYDGMSTDVDLEAQTPLTTRCDEEEEEAHCLREDAEYGIQTIMEQNNEQDDPPSVTDLAQCTADKSIIRKVSSSDEETSFSA